MKFLMVGAGALGGYFGARLLDAGQDVTFLVRAGRAEQLRQRGLRIHSPHGDLTLAAPPLVLSEQIRQHYDVVIVGCKAYDLDSTMASFAAAVGPQTTILPLLNGMAHIDRLAARFGRERVLGGLCLISATLDAQGDVQHLNDMHGLVFGVLDAATSPRVAAIAQAMSTARFDARAMLTAAGSPLTASMLKDLERGGAIEADHIIGDMLARDARHASPTLKMAYAHLKTYEARRQRATT